MVRRDLPSGTVTFLFTDIEGSTRLLHEVGPVGYERALGEHRRLLRDAFGRHGGVEVDTQGDAFFVAFSSALGAVEAAEEGRRALAAGPVRVRMGVHTGMPLVGAEGYVGADVHLGARIAACGHGGQILLSRATRELVGPGVELEDLGEHRLKDFDEPVWVYQLGSDLFPPLKTISNTNLPRAVSSFVGREQEIADVMALVRGGDRVVTLHGPGGSGKTRLAVEAAAELVPEFRNGVYWVGLAALRDSGLVIETIAKTVGSTNGLAEHIGEREVLLLLDNFEQVIDAAPAVSALLGECPSLRVLVTSRDLLRVRGEREYPVPPLAESEAVELFHRRSGVEPSTAIAHLCSRLDRLPLAVELAAARTGVLSPAQILERLGQRLDLLRGGRDADPRQQTLRATIAWSYDLLDEQERALFARLAVFRGGCTLEAAAEVVDATVDGLQSLVDKSLLRHSDERFWQLETIREYARERLGETSVDDDVRRRHAGYYLGFAEEIRRGVDAGGSLVEPGRRFAAEHDNLRSALEWARDTDQDDVLVRLTAAVGGHWIMRGLVQEANTWVALALDRASGSLAARVTVLRLASKRALDDGDLALALDLIGQHRAAAEEAGDTEEVERSIGLSASLAWLENDFDGARRLYLEAHDAAAQNGHDWVRASALLNLGFLHIEVEDYKAGLEYSNAAADLLRADEEESGLIVALLNGGCAQFCLGDPAAAAASYREALVVAGQMEATHRIANLALLLGAALIAVEDVERGAQLLGAGTALCAKLDLSPFSDELERQIHEQAAADAKKALGEGAYALAWERGAAMTADDIVRFAMGDELPPQTSTHPDDGFIKHGRRRTR